MEQKNFSVETDISEFSDLFNKTIEKASKVKEKQDAELHLSQVEANDLQNLLESLSGKEDQETLSQMLSLQAKLAALESEYEKLSSKSGSIKKQVHEAKQAVETLKEERRNQQNQAVHPRARYSVNIFRDMSKINWHENHEPNEVKGFVCSKTGLKTFCFDKEKQSNFFIANSLWEMGEDESEKETSDRKGRHGNY